MPNDNDLVFATRGKVWFPALVVSRYTKKTTIKFLKGLPDENAANISAEDFAEEEICDRATRTLKVDGKNGWHAENCLCGENAAQLRMFRRILDLRPHAATRLVITYRPGFSMVVLTRNRNVSSECFVMVSF